LNDKKEKCDVLVVFDLDGTLSRSHICILESVKRTLDAFSLPQVSEKLIMSLIGEQYVTFFSAIAPGCDDYVKMERVYTDIEYQVIRESGQLFPGVPEMLDALRALGCAIALCSNGSVEYEELVADATGIRAKFDALVSGGDFASKTAAVTRISTEMFPRKITVMVGDRKHDIDAALGNNAVAIAALYGYGSERELSGANYFVREPSEIVGIVKSLCQ
jgi:phosphoglycolate phosphatase